MAEGGLLGIGPQAVAGGHHNHHPPRGRQNPPDLPQQGDGIGALLQGVDRQDPVEQGVAERQAILSRQADPVGLPGRPELDPLLRRHGGHHPTRGRGQGAEERGGVAQAQHVLAVGVPPGLDHLAGGHHPRGLAEAGGVELAQFENVATHDISVRPSLDEARPPT